MMDEFTELYLRHKLERKKLIDLDISIYIDKLILKEDLVESDEERLILYEYLTRFQSTIKKMKEQLNAELRITYDIGKTEDFGFTVSKKQYPRKKLNHSKLEELLPIKYKECFDEQTITSIRVRKNG